ncbi:glycosyltransferase family 4 protein [Actinomycetospora lutea]|uniref:glycosyltransferase family 4 protein n=1 Tax=Actinomycetospora lutea TaxID=663604 RepID=UPI002365B8D3|nr:glycosyltransferase family 4 protein [Actinomycetospora lutea]MDD7940821.1 glycosyltransferase family 4 protein [Actinomycetospora lutea]
MTAPRTPRRLQVLVAGPSARTQGGMASVQRLLERWVPDDVELHVVATYTEGGVATRLRATLAGVGGAVRTLMTRRIDVVHVNLSKKASVLRKGVILTVGRLRGAATVVHAHAGLFLDWYDGLPRPAQALVRRLLVADRVIVLNATVRDGYAQRLGVPAGRMVMMTNPVEWPASVPERTDDGPVVAAFLGALREKKGVFDLVRAVDLLPAEARERLRVVAAGHEDPAPLRAAVRDTGVGDVIEVSGYLDAAARDALLARAQVLLLPSHAEGLPMSVLEAMAWGVTPVVTPVGGLPALIRDGENGVLVPVADPDALAAALGKLLVDDAGRHEIGARAREDVRGFAADAWAARLADLWRDVAGVRA